MINDEKENNEMEKEQRKLNNINDDYCYYNGDADYLIFPNDKEKRKRDNDININNNVDNVENNNNNIEGERIFKRFNDNNENYQYVCGKSGYDIYVKKQKEIEEELENENKEEYYDDESCNENDNEIDYNFNDESFLAYILWLLKKTFNRIKKYDNKSLAGFSPFCDTTILTYFFTCYIIANKFLLDVCMNPKSEVDALEFNHQNLLNNELSILALLNYYIIPSDEELNEFRKIIN
jgi:hypothetical protein